MRRYSFIALGGVLGAISRYYIKNIHILGYNGYLPLNTFIINITGSFILAMLLTTASEVFNFDEDIKLGIGTGFLGAYTTFSSMCKEAVILLRSGNFFAAFSYLCLSTIAGLFSAYLGYTVARVLLRKYSKKLYVNEVPETAMSRYKEEN